MSKTPTEVTLFVVDFEEHEDTLREIRHEVFVVGQRVPEDEEWDGLDPVHTTAHVLAKAPDGTPVATGRLLPGGKIGRLAVRAPWRGQGVGSAVLDALVQLASARGDAQAKVASQVEAIPFYERHGFSAHGEIFLDAGIEHRWMTKPL